MHEIEIICKYHVVDRLCNFIGRSAGSLFEDGEQHKANEHTQVKQWPDAQYAPDIKIGNVNGSLEFFFFYEQERYEKTAQHKKEVHAHVPVGKKERNILERPGMRVSCIVEKSKISMVQEHRKE
jgi:hypothetical protein